MHALAKLAVAAAVLAWSPAALAQTLMVTGPAGASRALSADDIARLPHQTVTVSEHGASASYDGVPFADLAGLVGAPQGEALRGPALADVVVVTAADGYRVALSLAETDPAMRPDPVLVADRKDGKPLDAHEGPFRLVVPGDKRPARSARSIVKIEIRALP